MNIASLIATASSLSIAYGSAIVPAAPIVAAETVSTVIVPAAPIVAAETVSTVAPIPEEQEAKTVELKVTKLSLFKAGYGYISLEGTLGNSLQPLLHPVPIPIKGSFWVEGEEGVDIKRVVSQMITSTREVTPDTENLIIANEGKKVTLRFAGSDNSEVRELTGIILPQPKPQVKSNNHTVGSDTTPSKDSTHRAYVCLLQTADNVYSIKTSQIEEIIFNTAPSYGKESVESPAVRLDLDKEAAGKKVSINCLSRELGWLPSYRLELMPDGKATLQAQATILNNVADLNNVEIELVSGTPSQINIEQNDPMSLIPDKQLLQTFGKGNVLITENRINTPVFERRYINSNNYQGNGIWSAQQVASTSLARNEEQPGVINTGELFFYPVKGVSMKAGEVVTQPLFTQQLDYSKIYTWKVGDPTKFDQDALNNVPHDAWSCIRFTNPLEMPLTAAPIEIIAKDRFAGMNELSYTAGKSACTIQMSRALNIELVKKATITNVQKKTLSLKSTSSQISTSNVELEVKNKTNEDIVMEITQEVVGELVSIGQEGVATKTPLPRAHKNKTGNTIRWTLNIPANETKKVEFTYKYIN